MIRYFGSYEGKLKTFLLLLVLFLAVAIYVSFHLLVVSRNAIFEEVRQRIALAADAVGSDLRIEDAPFPGRDEAFVESPFSQSQFSRIARRHDLVSLELLDPGGRVVVSSLAGRVGAADGGWAEMSNGERLRLSSGTTILSSLRSEGGAQYATMAGYRPLLDRAGRLRGVLRIEDRAENLAHVERSLRILSAIQATGLSALLILIFFFARWLLAPYRRLLATADQARVLETATETGTGEPDLLVSSFQAVLEKMRSQELELQRFRSSRVEDPEDSFPAESLAESLTSGMITFDRQGKVRLVNPAALQILGRSRADVEGVHYVQLLGGPEGLGGLVKDGLERGVPRSREMVPLRRPDGKEIHLGVGLSPILRAAGEVEGLVCLLSDLTEIGHLRERVALKENLARLGELSAGIAHEFRNSLATILGYARLIARGSDPEQRDMGASIEKEVHGIRTVVQDFLQFARPAPLNLTEVRLGELLNDLGREMTAPDPALPFQVVVSGEFPPLMADESLLKQAFHNLIRNAAQSRNGRGVQVTITGSVEEGDTLRIDVADDGPGIPPEALPRIFTPFFTTRADGTGLGLPLVQKTIVSHDGTIQVTSAVGAGTRFLIRLPLRRPAEPLNPY